MENIIKLSICLIFFLALPVSSNMSVQKISDLEIFQYSISQNGLVIVDFYADWCPPCIVISPKMDELAKKYPKVFFYKVDVDENQDIAILEKIAVLPTFHVYKDGKFLESIVGANLKLIKKTIKKYI